MDINETLKARARDWAQMVVNLHNTPVPTKFEAQKRALLESAKKIKTAVEAVIGTVPELQIIDEQVQLGFVPLVIGVGAAAAAAAITYWVTSYKKFIAEVDHENKKLATYNELVKSGTDPKAAANIVTNTFKKPGSVLENVTSIMMLAVVGGGLFLLARKK